MLYNNIHNTRVYCVLSFNFSDNLNYFRLDVCISSVSNSRCMLPESTVETVKHRRDAYDRRYPAFEVYLNHSLAVFSFLQDRPTASGIRCGLRLGVRGCIFMRGCIF